MTKLTSGFDPNRLTNIELTLLKTALIASEIISGAAILTCYALHWKQRYLDFTG